MTLNLKDHITQWPPRHWVEEPKVFVDNRSARYSQVESESHVKSCCIIPHNFASIVLPMLLVRSYRSSILVKIVFPLDLVGKVDSLILLAI